MEYFEILNDFLSNNRIESNIVPYIIELFELNRDAVFLGEENRNISNLYKMNDIKSIISNREAFLNLESSKLDKFISELKSLKTVTDEETHTLIDGLISDKEKFREKIELEKVENKEEDLDKYKRSLEFKFENNRRKILLRYSKLKDLESKFEKLNKKELFDDLNDVMNSIKIKTRFDSDDSFLILLSKIEAEQSKLDINYLISLGLNDEVEAIESYRDRIFGKDDAIKYLNRIFDLSIKHSKPLSNNENMLKIAILEQTLFSKNIYSYFERIKEHPELTAYYVMLKNQLDDLNKDILSEEDQEKYLNALPSVLDTIKSLNTKVLPLRVDKYIFDYDASYESVKTVEADKDKRIVEYTKGDVTAYSIIENRDKLLRDLDYWKKEIDYGFDRYDKGDFYEEVFETFNLIKFYYRFKNYVVYSDVSNKNFNISSSIEMTNKDKLELDKLKTFLNSKMESIRTRGIDYWKEENNPRIHFAISEKISESDQIILFNCLIPEDGIGRQISSPVMLNNIYGSSYVKSKLNELKDKKEK